MGDRSHIFHITIDLGGDTTSQRANVRDAIERLVKLEQAFDWIAEGERQRDEILHLMNQSTRSDFDLLDSPIESSLWGLPTQLMPSTGGRPPGRRPSNVLLYEKILEEHGRPMYLQDITQEALSRGLDLGGRTDRSSEEKVRNSLTGSKRFQNLGMNRWWLADTPMPEQNSHAA